MADRRGGLPTKLKNVTRLNKSTGKMSLYRQTYHVSPFQKTEPKKGGPAAPPASNVASDFNKAVSTRPRKENSMKLVDYVNKLTPSNGEIGTVATNNIIKKLRNLNDTKVLKEAYFDKVFSQGFFNSEHSKNYKGLLRDTARIVNNLPKRTTDYSEIVSSIVNHRQNINDGAMASIVSSFQDHKMLHDAIRLKTNKSESYDKEEFLHDFYIKFANPTNQIGSYLGSDEFTDTAKASIQSVYGVPNDLKYINNVPTLTDQEIRMWENFINEHNNYVHSNMQDKELYKHILLKLSPIVAAAMFKSEKVYNLPIYQSTLSQLYGSVDDTNLKKIKDINIDTGDDANFKANKSKFVIDGENNVYLSTILSMNELYYKDFVSIPKDNSIDVMDRYSKKSKEILKENNGLSHDEINKGIDEQRDIFDNKNDDSFVTINM
jgi:hypothetical protein